MSKQTKLFLVTITVLVILYMFFTGKKLTADNISQYINESVNETPNMPWQNKLPSDFSPIDFALSLGDINYGDKSIGDFLFNLTLGDMIMGDSSMNIDLGDYLFGDVNLNNNFAAPPVDAKGCNVCQITTEAQPIAPYQERPAIVPDNTPLISSANGRNTSTPLLFMAGVEKRNSLSYR